VSHRRIAVLLSLVIASTSLGNAACTFKPRTRPLHTEPIDTGAGSVTETRKMLEGTWKLESLELVDATGARRPVKAGGELTYDGFGNMNIRGVIEEPAVKDSLVIDYNGRITIDPVRHEFYPADLASDRPLDATQIAPISPDKVRKYELSANAFVVTYIDAAAKPTAVARWRR
jgi:hypothetical protein